MIPMEKQIYHIIAIKIMSLWDVFPIDTFNWCLPSLGSNLGPAINGYLGVSHAWRCVNGHTIHWKDIKLEDPSCHHWSLVDVKDPEVSFVKSRGVITGPLFYLFLYAQLRLIEELDNCGGTPEKNYKFTQFWSNVQTWQANSWKTC